MTFKPGVIDMLEFADGFAIRAAKPSMFQAQFEHVAYLRKADGWTRETAEMVVPLAEKIKSAQVRLQVTDE